jgi:hypothetical protein
LGIGRVGTGSQQRGENEQGFYGIVALRGQVRKERAAKKLLLRSFLAARFEKLSIPGYSALLRLASRRFDGRVNRAHRYSAQLCGGFTHIKRFDIRGIPANLLVDSTGSIVAVDVPFPKLYKQLQQAL